MAYAKTENFLGYTTVSGDYSTNLTPIPNDVAESYSPTKYYSGRVTATYNASSGTPINAGPQFTSITMLYIYNYSTTVTATLLCVLGSTVGIDLLPGRSLRLPMFSSLSTLALRAPNGFTADCLVIAHGS